MTDAPPPSPERDRTPATVRLAVWSARHRWPVFLLWFVATIGLFFASVAGGGTRTEGLGGNQGEVRL